MHMSSLGSFHFPLFCFGKYNVICTVLQRYLLMSQLIYVVYMGKTSKTVCVFFCVLTHTAHF